MKQHNVFPECNVDTNLVGFILGGYAKHKSSCNEVVKAVNHAAGFAIGVIDADNTEDELSVMAYVVKAYGALKARELKDSFW